jgi:predicted  nucleic acid-binding Zn-ribbon protein
MNWIAEQFEKLKARVEAHIPATNKALNDLDRRISGTETYTQKAVENLESRLNALEQKNATVTHQGIVNLDQRVKTLESRGSGVAIVDDGGAALRAACQAVQQASSP